MTAEYFKDINYSPYYGWRGSNTEAIYQLLLNQEIIMKRLKNVEDLANKILVK